MILRDESWVALLRAVHLMAVASGQLGNPAHARNLADLHGVLRAMYARDRDTEGEPDGPALLKDEASRVIMDELLAKLMKGT